MNVERLTKVIIAPCVSEKSAKVQMDRQYIFRVNKKATKNEVASAMRLLFSVDIEAVRICNVKGEKRSFKNIIGYLPNWKKAYVTVKEGQTINLGGA
ncbi:MAG: 50S ribosomal protein L23 [Coxiellaceae bacterium]|jgi:large subunit ribosomal protein L23|nr:50S ribosomal protein L23 [Coxiellaceae bacterium]